MQFEGNCLRQLWKLWSRLFPPNNPFLSTLACSWVVWFFFFHPKIDAKPQAWVAFKIRGISGLSPTARLIHCFFSPSSKKLTWLFAWPALPVSLGKAIFVLTLFCTGPTGVSSLSSETKGLLTHAVSLLPPQHYFYPPSSCSLSVCASYHNPFSFSSWCAMATHHHMKEHLCEMLCCIFCLFLSCTCTLFSLIFRIIPLVPTLKTFLVPNHR